MQPPAKTPLPDPSVITQTIQDGAATATPSISDPVQLFAADYDAAHGRITNLTPSSPQRTNNNNGNASLAGNTRPLPGSVERHSPRRKRVTSSPRRAVLAAARVVTQLSQPITQPPNTAIAAPPALRRNGPSPTSVIDAALPVQSPFVASTSVTPKRNHKSFHGQVPRSDFIKWARPKHFGTGNYDPAIIKKGLNQRRLRIFHHFNKTSNCDRRGQTTADVEGGGSGPVTRSSVEEEDDWIIDQSAVDITTTDTRRLSIYCFEQLLLCKERDKFVILVKVSEEQRLFKGIGQTVSELQGTDTTVISGHEYYRLKATITDATHNANARGEGLPYSESDFQNAFDRKNGEFEVRFDGTHKIKRFNWKTIVNDANSLKFFGAPLAQPRTFDFIFKGPTTDATLYHRFIHFYDEFEGDVNACLALYNCYLSRRVAVLEAKLKQPPKEKEKHTRHIHRDLFKSKDVVAFADKVDKLFETNMAGMYTSWRVHTEPLVVSEEMQELIDEAAVVFGDFWTTMCELRGVRNWTKEKVRNIAKKRDVLFQILSMMRMANRSKLQYWGLSFNVTNLARGITRKVEKALSYFGMSVSSATRSRLLAKLTGNDAAGRASGNTLKDKQNGLLHAARALILCYDNYQRGVKLQHQRGEHSSAFYKGTHQCAHKVIEYTDTTFDAFFAQITHHDQSIPSPVGMPAFEYLDFGNVAELTSVVTDYDSFETYVEPNWEGDRVSNYIAVC